MLEIHSDIQYHGRVYVFYYFIHTVLILDKIINRLGYHIVSAIIRQLVQLVTLAPNTVISADEETSNISYVGLRNLVLDTVITGFEREYTTMMHIIANDTR